MKKEDIKSTNNDDIEEMINEKKRNTKDLTEDMNKAKKKLKEELETTKIFDPKKSSDKKEEKVKKETKVEKETKNISILTDISVFLVFTVGYFIYYFLYTDNFASKKMLFLNIGIIITLFVLYFITIILKDKFFKVLEIIIVIIILIFVGINLLNTLGISVF